MLVTGMTSVASAIPGMDSSSLPSENFDDSSSSSVMVTTSLDTPISDPLDGSWGARASDGNIEIWGYPTTDITSSLNFDSPVLGGSFAVANYGPVSAASSLGLFLPKTAIVLPFKPNRIASTSLEEDSRVEKIESLSAIPVLLICLFQVLCLRRRRSYASFPMKS